MSLIRRRILEKTLTVSKGTSINRETDTNTRSAVVEGGRSNSRWKSCLALSGVIAGLSGVPLSPSCVSETVQVSVAAHDEIEPRELRVPLSLGNMGVALLLNEWGSPMSEIQFKMQAILEALPKGGHSGGDACLLAVQCHGMRDARARAFGELSPPLLRFAESVAESCRLMLLVQPFSR